MAGSLFDQLKKSGLVDEKKAQRVKREKYQQSKKKQGKKGQPVLTESAKAALALAEKKKQLDQKLNAERKHAQEEKAKVAELKQVIESNKLSDYTGDINYSFVDESVVKSITVNKKIHRALTLGQIRLARFEGGVVLVPDTVVERINQRDTSVLIPLPETSDDSISQEDQDYYAQFEIPDDLVW